MIKFNEVKKLLDNSDITALEERVGYSFPQEYREHLLAYNGGFPDKQVFAFEENGKQQSSDVDWFYAIYDGKYNNLDTAIKMYKLDEKRLPQHIIPIAHDSGGNQICISCGTEDYGKVYFWNHELEVDYSVAGDDDYSNLYLIADSFTEFINGLMSFDEYDKMYRKRTKKWYQFWK